MDNAFGRAYVDYMFQYIFDKVDNDIKVNIEEKNLEIIKETIKKEIFIKCFKSLLYCMNMARGNNELCGASAEERYSYFCNNKDLMIADMERMFPEMRNQVDREVRKKLIYLVPCRKAGSNDAGSAAA